MKKFTLFILLSFLLNLNKSDAQTWNPVGSAGFSGGVSEYTSLAIDKSGTPYVVYSDYANSGRATVMKFNGTSWVIVGNADFSAGEADYTSIAIDTGGTPYVTYRDWGNGRKATGMKYNGSISSGSWGWNLLGSAGFSAGVTKYTSIAIDGDGKAYVAYMDQANGDKATVMKFNTDAGVKNIGYSANDITLFPNPTQNNFTVASPEPINSIVICNLIGQEVYSGSYNTNNAVVSLEQLPVGVYVVKVNGEKVYKVVKE